MRKYKTARKTKVTKVEKIYYVYEYACPFCKTKHYSNMIKDVIRIKCNQCGNEIILDWGD